MTPETVARMYTLAMAADSRLTRDSMTPEKAQVWAELFLADIPDEHHAFIIQHIYRTPQMLTLQPGHIIEAWAEIEKTVGKKIQRVRALTTSLDSLNPKTRDDIEDYNDLVEAYMTTAKELPAYVRHGLGLKPISPLPVPTTEKAQPPASLRHLVASN